MALTRPTLSELVTRIRADLGSRVLGNPAAVLRNSVLNVLALVLAAATHALYGYADWAVKQMMPDTATGWFLERWAAIWGITRNAGTQATGAVEFTGTNGTAISSGTALVREDGVRFETTAGGSISGGVLSLAIEAVDVGDTGDTDTGVVLQLESAIAGVDSEATVETPGVTGGADRESDTSLRARLLLRIRKPPQGGTAADFEQWALATHTDVTRAYIQENTPTYGYVTVQVIADDGAGGVTPDPAVLTAVEDYIDPRRPLTCTVIVTDPTPVPVNITVEISPDTADIRDAVEAELLAMFTSRAEPGTDIRLSWIIEAISTATGEEYNSVTVPAADTAIATDEIGVLGTITWV